MRIRTRDLVMSKKDMNNIILSKYLFRKAQNSWQPHDRLSNGLTVSLLQDSAEMMLWEMVKTHNAQIKIKEGFVSLLDNLDRSYGGIDFKAQILEVNSARVNFKHYGNIPSSIDVTKFIESTRAFLEANAKKIGYDYQNISLADAINNATVKDLINKAEKLIIDGDNEEALISISMAYSHVEDDAKRLVFDNLPNFENAYELFPEDKQEDARDVFSDVSDFLDEFTWLTSLTGLGYSKQQVLDIHNRCAEVVMSMGGKRLGVHPRAKTEATVENVEHLIRSVTDMAISLYE